MSSRSSHGIDEIVLEDGSVVERGSWLAELPFEEKLDLVDRATEASSNVSVVARWLSSLSSQKTACPQDIACVHESYFPGHIMQSSRVQAKLHTPTFEEDRASSCTLTSSKSSETIGKSSVLEAPLYDIVLPPAREDGIFRTRSIFARKIAPSAALSPFPGGKTSLRVLAWSAMKTRASMRPASYKHSKVSKPKPARKQIAPLTLETSHRRIAKISTRGMAMALKESPHEEVASIDPSSPSYSASSLSTSIPSPSTFGKPDPVSQHMRDTHDRYLGFLKEREMDLAMGL